MWKEERNTQAMKEDIPGWHPLGRILTRKLPPITHDEFLAWWPALTRKERDRYTIDDTHNLITSLGRAQILGYIGSPTFGTAAFAQYFAVGSFAVNSVQPGDTGMNWEQARVVPSAFTISGNTVDISCFFGALIHMTFPQLTTLTQCGLFGATATQILGSGTMMTSALLGGGAGVVKDNAHSMVFDYTITLN